MSRNQTRQIVIRMTENDYQILKKRIDKSGLCQAEYLRQAALKKQIISAEGIKAILPELKRIGNNLNQIARKCNEGCFVSRDEIQKQFEEMSAVWRLLRQYPQGQASATQ